MTGPSEQPSIQQTYRFSHEQWLESFLRVILRASLVVGLILIIAALATNTQTILLAIYISAYIIVLVAFLAPLSYRIRAVLFLVILCIMGISGLLELGIRGDSRIFFAIFIIMTSILFGSRATRYAIAATFIAHAIVGALIFTGVYKLIESSIPTGGIDAWVMSFLTTTLMAFVVTTGQRMLVDEFYRAQDATFSTLELLTKERDTLEQRVEERTKDLGQRAVKLQAAADVGSAATRLRNLDDLLNQTTHLISERFEYYHVGIFLLDDKNEFAILRASNSEGGQRMLSRGHKLQVGQVGIVGNVTGSGIPRIALDVGQDATYFDNPDLPETRSELALPLIIGKKIIGALDVQSQQANAFTEEDITILKVLADQVAIAIDNARLFSDTQIALENTRRAYRDIARTGWNRLLEEEKATIGYISFPGTTATPVKNDPSPEAHQAITSGETIISNEGLTLNLPIKVRGEAIGVIKLDKPTTADKWSQDDLILANALVDQLGVTLESARLYGDISRRAEREQIISDITKKIGSSIQLDTILRNTVQELGHALADSEVILQIGGLVSKGNPRE